MFPDDLSNPSMIASLMVTMDSLKMQNDQIRLMEQQAFESKQCKQQFMNQDEYAGAQRRQFRNAKVSQSKYVPISDDVSSDEIARFGRIVSGYKDGIQKTSSIHADVKDGKFIIVFDYKDKMITEREAVKTIHQGFQIAKKLGFKPVDCVITDEKGNVINKEVFHVQDNQ